MSNTENNGDEPINFKHISESFELAMKSNDEIPEEAVEEIVEIVSEAVANNEEYLMWKKDYIKFMRRLDKILDEVHGKGLDEQIKQLDDLRAKMEPLEI